MQQFHSQTLSFNFSNFTVSTYVLITKVQPFTVFMTKESLAHVHAQQKKVFLLESMLREIKMSSLNMESIYSQIDEIVFNTVKSL